MNVDHLLGRRTRSGRNLWVAAVATFVLAGLAASAAYRQFERADQAAASYGRLLAKQARPANTPGRAELEDQRRWAALNLERAFAWEPVFKAVESATGSNIELLEMQPDKNNRRILLRGEARDRKALIDFVSALASQAALANVHLVREQSVDRKDMETLTFEIKASVTNT